MGERLLVWTISFPGRSLAVPIKFFEREPRFEDVFEVADDATTAASGRHHHHQWLCSSTAPLLLLLLAARVG